MSLYDYKISQEIAIHNYPFYALIMAAIRQADTENFDKLKSTFPIVYRELIDRYDAPGGHLPGE